jgi:hypothetical protein
MFSIYNSIHIDFESLNYYMHRSLAPDLPDALIFCAAICHMR